MEKYKGCEITENKNTIIKTITQLNIVESLDSKILGCKDNCNETIKNTQKIQREVLHTEGLNYLKLSNDGITKRCNSITNRNAISTHKVESQERNIMDCHAFSAKTLIMTNDTQDLHNADKLQSNMHKEVTTSCNNAVAKSKPDVVSNSKKTNTI